MWKHIWSLKSSSRVMSFFASFCLRYSGATVRAVTWPCHDSPCPSTLPITATNNQSILNLPIYTESKLGGGGERKGVCTDCIPWCGGRGRRPRGSNRASERDRSCRRTYWTRKNTCQQRLHKWDKTEKKRRENWNGIGRRGKITVSVRWSRLTWAKRSRSSQQNRRMLVIAAYPFSFSPI